MDEMTTEPADLHGTADERRRQLEELTTIGTLDADWLRRQLDAVIDAWANDETTLDIDKELHVDF
ncbi:MAG TPA: hypothetical protein VNP97_09590 [Microbacterium sp.]|nr:hypothetical protein [Microbacterium sp.]